MEIYAVGDWDYWALLQTVGIGGVTVCLLVVCVYQLWRQILLPWLDSVSRNQQRKAEIDTDTYQAEQKEKLRKQAAETEALQVQTELYSGLGDVLEVTNTTLTEVMSRLSLLIKEHTVTSEKVALLEGLLSEVANDDELKEQLPAFKKSVVTVLKALKRKGDILPEEFEACEKLMGEHPNT